MTQRFGIRLEIEADSADAARQKLESLGASVKRVNGLRVDDAKRSFEALEARLDPAAKAARNLTRDTEALNKALAAGAVGQDRYTQLLARAKEAHDRLATGQRAVIQNTGATAQQLAQLQPQLNDIFTQLSTGTSLFTVFAQQGPQITQIFGGLRNTIAAIPAPLLAVAAAAVAVGGTFALWNRHVESIREMDRANRLLGNGLGLTRDGLDALATSAAAAGNVSVNAARGMVAEYTRAGKIGADTMTRLVGLTRDYAAATGQEASDATKELAQTFRDPAKGATELADKFGLLNAAQLQHIKTLADSGKASEAQGALVDALARRIAGAAEQTSIWARAWNAVSNAASNAADNAGRAIDRAVNGPSLEQRIAAAKQAVERARAVAQEDAALGGADKSWKPGQSIGEAPSPATARDDVAATERAYTDLLVQKQERDRRARAQAKARADADASRAAEDVARGLNPVGVALEDVNGKVARLEKGLGTGLTTGAANGAAALEALKNQAADYTRVAATGLDLETYKRGELLKVEQKAATMIGPAREQYLATERARVDLIGTATTAAQRKAAVETATGQAVAAHTAQVTEQTTQLRLQTEAQHRLADAAGQGEAAQRRAAIENAVAAASIQGMGEATRAALEAQEAFTVALVRNEQTNPVERQIRQQKELAAAVAQGPAAAHAAELATKAHALALREAKEGTAEFNTAFAHYLELLKRADSADFGVPLEKYGQQLADQRRRLGLDAALVGKPESVRTVAEAQQQVVEWLRAQGKEYDQLDERERRRVDNILRIASENAEITQGIKRQEAAWKTVTDSLEKAFDRVGDAIVEAFAQGQTKAINWGGVVKGVIASIVGDLLKMAVINPFKNMVFGSNSPTLMDLGGGSSSSGAGAAGGSGNGLLGQATNWGLSKAMGWGAEKLGIGTSPGGVGMVDQVGMQMGFGAPTITSGALAAGYAAPTVTLANGSVVAASPAVQASQVAMLQSANAGTTGTLGAAGSSSMPALSGVLGSAGAGAFGGAVGGMIGTATNSKAIGGVSGAALGAGSAWAMGAMMGAAAGPIGMIIGAIIGAIVGLVTTQKKSTNYGGAYYETDAQGNFVAKGSGADPTVADKLPAIEQTAKASSDILNAIVKAGGLTLGTGVNLASATEKGEFTTKLGGWDGPVVSSSEDPAVIAAEALRYLDAHGGVTGNADVLTALRHTKATDAQGIATDLDYAKAFSDTLSEMRGSLSPVGNAFKTMRETAQQLGESVKKNITAWRDKAVELGLATSEELAPALRQGFEAMIGLGSTADPLRGLQAILKQVEVNVETLRPAMAELGYTADQQADIIRRVTEQATSDYRRMVSTVTHPGRLAVEQAIDPKRKITADEALRSAGLADARFANGGFGDAFRSYLANADAGTATANDLRYLFGLLNTELSEGTVTAEQYNSVLGVATERYRAVADAAQAAAELQQQAAQTRLQALQEEAQRIQGLGDQWRGFVSSLGNFRRSLLLDTNLSPLSPQQKVEEARRQYDEVMSRARLGDVSAIEQVEGIARSRLEAERSYYASSEDYFRSFQSVQSDISGVETLAGRQARIADEQLTELRRQSGLLQGVLQASNTNRVRGAGESFDPWTAMIGQVSVGSERLWGVERGYSGVFGQGGYQSWIDQTGLRSAYNHFVYGMADGGWVAGGTPGKDSVPRMLMPDEFVVRAPVARRHGATLQAMNDGHALNDNREVVAELREIKQLHKALLYESAEQRAEVIRLRRDNNSLRNELSDRALQQRRTGTYA